MTRDQTCTCQTDPSVRLTTSLIPYRLDFLGCLFQTMASPFYRVSFAANILGDVLTYDARPGCSPRNENVAKDVRREQRVQSDMTQ